MLSRHESTILRNDDELIFGVASYLETGIVGAAEVVECEVAGATVALEREGLLVGRNQHFITNQISLYSGNRRSLSSLARLRRNHGI